MEPQPAVVKTPAWVGAILSRYEQRVEPYMEVEVAEALRAARNDQGDLSEDDWEFFLWEWSAFLFRDSKGKESTWGTYFAPMMSGKNTDDSDFFSPDIRVLDMNTLTYWEERARSCRNPVMCARYSDLVWDLKQRITGNRPSPDYARIAIDSYTAAADNGLYTMEICAIRWLSRALDLSLLINDADRTKGVAEFMFEFYDRVAKPQFAGTWLFLFDNLYGRKFISPEQESRIIANLEAMLSKTSDTTASETGVYSTLDPWAAEAAAQRLAQHYRRNNDKTNVERVVKAYGSSFQFMAAQASPLLATAWLEPVIERYEQEGLKGDAEKLQLMSAGKGKSIETDLKQYTVQVEVKAEDIEQLAEEVFGREDLSAALARIASNFIPRVGNARRLLDELRSVAPLISIIPIKVVARDGHTAAMIGSLDDDPDGRLHKQLAETIDFHQPFLAHILSKLRERYNPGVDSILDFLCQSPLFADRRTSLLRDGLVAYGEEDLVKAIHVLVPQVEDILRNFLGHLGRPTLKTVRNHPGTMDAKSMNEVLGDQVMRDALTENLWRYLEVVYTDKRGLNLRNNLAHGLLERNAFNRYIADRVFHTLLALSLMRAAQDPAN